MAGEDHAILAARHALYLRSREQNPARWSGFVCTLAWSRHQYAEIVRNQSTPPDSDRYRIILDGETRRKPRPIPEPEEASQAGIEPACRRAILPRPILDEVCRAC